MGEGISDEEAKDMEETHKESMDLMTDDSKPHFTNI